MTLLQNASIRLALMAFVALVPCVSGAGLLDYVVTLTTSQLKDEATASKAGARDFVKSAASDGVELFKVQNKFISKSLHFVYGDESKSSDQANREADQLIANEDVDLAKVRFPIVAKVVVNLADSVDSKMGSFAQRINGAVEHVSQLLHSTVDGDQRGVVAADTEEVAYLAGHTHIYGGAELPDALSPMYVEQTREDAGLTSKQIYYADPRQDPNFDSRVATYASHYKDVGWESPDDAYKSTSYSLESFAEEPDDTEHTEWTHPNPFLSTFKAYKDRSSSADIATLETRGVDPADAEIDELVTHAREKADSLRRNSMDEGPSQPSALQAALPKIAGIQHTLADSLAQSTPGLLSALNNIQASAAGTASRRPQAVGSSSTMCQTSDYHSLDCATIKVCTRLQFDAMDAWLRDNGTHADPSALSAVQTAQRKNRVVMSASCADIHSVIERLSNE